MSEQVPSYTAVECAAHRETLRAGLALIGDGIMTLVVQRYSPMEFAIRAGCNALGQIAEMQSRVEFLEHQADMLRNVASEAQSKLNVLRRQYAELSYVMGSL